MRDTERFEQYTRESELLEYGFLMDPPHHRRHLEAAAYAKEWATPGKHGWIVHPQILHEMVFAGMKDAGKLRMHDMCSGNLVQPVEHLALFYKHWMSGYLRNREAIVNRASPYRKEWIVNRAWFVHDWFLCVAPFDRGNGIIARLMLNAILTYGNIRWRTIRWQEHARYCARHKDFATRVFPGWYHYLPVYADVPIPKTE